MAIKIAINGMGRIGMTSSRIIGTRDDIELVAVNATCDIDTLVQLIKYDSVHRSFDVEKIDETTLRIGNQRNVKFFSDREPTNVMFGKLGAKVVIDATGVFTKAEKAKVHLHDGVEKVVISAPADEDTPTFVMGINEHLYNGETVVSNASCTTNCLAPIAKVLHENFGIEVGLMTTVHSYTNDQNILDVKHKDIRRARAAALNMIPTTTGAAKAIGLVMPELKGKLNGFAIRVPTPDVSVVDLSCTFTKSVSKDAINEAMEKAANGAMKKYILIDKDKRVSSDFIGCPINAIFVPDFTMVVGDKSAKILAWYDNEWGYSNRLVDMAKHVGSN